MTEPEAATQAVQQSREQLRELENPGSQKRIEAWNRWAELNPRQWESYRGGCCCPSCRSYRSHFEAWLRSGMLASLTESKP